MGTYSVTTNPVKQSVLFNQKQQNLKRVLSVILMWIFLTLT